MAVVKERLSRYLQGGTPVQIVTTRMQQDVPAHIHDFIELVYFDRGTAMHNLLLPDGTVNSFPVFQGDCFTILPGERHSFTDGNNAFYYNLIFPAAALGGDWKKLQTMEAADLFFNRQNTRVRHKIRLTVTERARFKEQLDELRKEKIAAGPMQKAAVRARLLLLLLTLLRTEAAHRQAGRAPEPESLLAQTLLKMEEHPEKKFTLPELARQAGMCPASFTRKFRLLTGFAPVEYLLRLRIAMAEKLLVTERAAIGDVACRCGFYDSASFIRHFRRFCAVTPSVYRKQAARKTGINGPDPDQP